MFYLKRLMVFVELLAPWFFQPAPSPEPAAVDGRRPGYVTMGERSSQPSFDGRLEHVHGLEVSLLNVSKHGGPAVEDPVEDPLDEDDPHS